MTVGRIAPSPAGIRRAPSPAPSASGAASSGPSPAEGAGPSPFRDALETAARSIGRGERIVQRAIHAGRHGGTLGPEQLIALQAGVYRYTQELELASKVADKSASAVRQTLQSQQ